MSEAKDLGLGKIITDPAAARDAVHIAVAPVTLACDMEPGEAACILPDGRAGDVTMIYELVGIIDPFLTVGKVKKGTRCWLFLYPGTITGLRHLWRHPAFERKTTVASEIISGLQEYADKLERDSNQRPHPSLTEQENI